MQQTFPAGTAQRIVMFDIRGDLFVHGWEQQTIQVTTDGRIDQLQPEDDTLTIRNCNNTLELMVPIETVIEAKNIKGGVVIENVRQVEADVIGGDVSIKTISGDVAVTKIGGDAAITSVGDELELTNVGGGLSVKEASSVHIRGHVGDDASFMGVERIDIERIDGDLVLIDVDEAIIKQVKGDLYGKSGIALLRAGAIGGDCQVQGDGNAEVLLGSVGSDLGISGASRFEVGNVGGDCLVQESANGEGKISNVGNDLKILGATRLQIGNVGNDCELRDVQGEVSLSQVGNDATLLGIAGNLHVGNIGDDAHLRGIGGSVNIGNIGSDLHLQAVFPVGSEVHASVGGDARILLPANANLTINARAGGDVKGHAIVSNFAGNFVNLVYGEGAAQLELNVGGDLELQSSESPRSSNSKGGNAGNWNNFGSNWNNFGADWGQFGHDLGREMSEFGRDLTAAFSEVTTSFSSDIADNVAAAKEQAHRAQREAEERRRRAEQERQRAMRKAEEQRQRAEQERQRAKREGKWAGEQNPYFNVRINEREWKMGPDRIDAIVEQAREAAAGGIHGALEAVEQALKNIHVMPPVPPTPSRPTPPPVPPMPGTPPVPPMPGETAAPSSTASASSYATSNATEASSSVDGETPMQNEAGEHPTDEVAGKAANLDQEREAILRMIAEGRISPEEGDLLLEALGS